MTESNWAVHVTDNFALDADVVIMYRRRPDQRLDFIKSIDIDGTTILETVDDGLTPPAMTGFTLPRGVLEAIAEHVKPGPSRAEILRLDETLAVERARVDRILTSFIGRS